MRIMELPVTTEAGVTDYLAIDNTTNGTRKILARDLSPSGFVSYADDQTSIIDSTDAARARSNIKIISATTSAEGLVQLYDGIDSTATNKAATANSAKKAYDDAIKIPCNPNLLDNWYFIGGGSQQGGGQFPINQRGQTTYSASAYCVDRWKTDSDVTAKINAGGLQITDAHAQYAKGIIQTIEDACSMLGKTVTASVYRYGGTFDSGTVTIGSSFPASGSVNYDAVDNDRLRLRITLTNAGKCIFYAQSRASNNFTAIAIKLEIGTQQTLCYWDGSAWQLREVPNFTEQLLRCQRFQYVLSGAALTTLATGFCANTTTVRFKVPLPVPMAKNTGTASVIGGSVSNANIFTNRNAITPSAVVSTVYGTSKGNADVEFTVAGVTQYDPAILSTSSADLKILIDCNL